MKDGRRRNERSCDFDPQDGGDGARRGRRGPRASAWFVCAALAAMMVAAPARAGAPVSAAPAAGRWRDASLDDYRKHLMALTTLVEACAKARDLKNCDPLLVGPDDRVPLGAANAERRLVRYGWLRVLFSKAEEPDAPAPKPASGKQDSPKQTDTPPTPFTTSQLLKDAEKRLASDLAQTDGSPVAVPAYPPEHVKERDAMQQVLAGRDFANLQQLSVREAVMEKLDNWLNRLYESASRLQARSAWVGLAIVWGFVLAVCVGLVWGLLQLERRWRVRLVPEVVGPATGAASVRDWQLWLRDARTAAAAGKWREAVHFVYWAVIARLESQRLWPADRARTPREYLGLVALEDPRKAGLAQLTGKFERTWYGGRTAGEEDYQEADKLAASLMAGVQEGGGG